MTIKDEFGHDPNVQRTRKYFSQMEDMDADLIKRSGISLFDPRLRDARSMRFKLFEHSCSRAVGKAIRLDERVLIELFELCQHMAFKKCELPVSSLDHPENPELMSLVREGIK